jgi:tetratricopeptide (TPR) repeat protein
MMKKFFVVLSSLAVSFSIAGCTTSDSNSNNSNQTNSNAPIANVANTNAANVSVSDTPLPEFTDAETALNEGKKLLDANQTEKAAEALKQAVKLNPDLGEAHFNLGVAYALIEKATENLPTKEEETPTPTPTRKGKKQEEVVLSQSDKAFENAAKAYEKVIKKNPKDDAAFYNLGRSYNKLNKDKESEKALRQAVKLKPDDSEYQTEFGAILIKLAQYDEAVSVLKKVVAKDEGNSHAQDLLEKAEAGQKRINFGVKPKSEGVARGNAPPPPRPGRTRSGGDSPSPNRDTAPRPSAPSAPASSKPTDKKGN